MQWTGILSWEAIDRTWGDLHDFLKANLDLQSYRQMDLDGKWEEAHRPMIEDIVCCRASKDPRMVFYLRAAGLDVTEINGRPPKKFQLGVGHKIGIASGSTPRLGKKKK